MFPRAVLLAAGASLFVSGVTPDAIANPSAGGLLVLRAQDAADDPEAGPDLSPKTAASRSLKTVAILILSGEESGVRHSDIFTNATKAIETNTALDVLALDPAQSNKAIRECAGRAACFAARVRESATRVDQLLTVSVDRLDEGMLLGLRLVDVSTGDEIGASGDEVPMGMSLLGAMEQQLPGVFPNTIWGQIARVKIETQPENAEVSIGGRSCASPCELTRMTPGTYDVTIKKAGYDPYSGTVTLKAKDTAQVTATLVEPPGGITSSPWFWGGVGVAAVGAGVAAFFLLRPSSRVVNLCVSDDPAKCEQ